MSKITLEQMLNEPSYQLTPLGKKIVTLVTKGYSNAEIAKETGKTESVIKQCLTNVYGAMEVKTRAQLIVKCLPYINFNDPTGPITTPNPDGTHSLVEQPSQHAMINTLARAEQEFNDRQQAEHERITLSLADNSCSPIAQYVMGMLSDVQECIRMGNSAMANDILNNAKLIIDQRLSTKDPQGRQDFSPAEVARRDR